MSFMTAGTNVSTYIILRSANLSIQLLNGSQNTDLGVVGKEHNALAVLPGALARDEDVFEVGRNLSRRERRHLI